MNTPVNLVDQVFISKYRILLTEHELGIPGLRCFGFHNRHKAQEAIPWHYHKDAFEFSLPSRGIYHFANTQKTYSFSSEEVHISFPNEVHSTNHLPFPSGHLYWFQLDISDEDAFLFMHPQKARQFIQQLKSIPKHVIYTEKKGLSLIKSAFDAAYKGEDPVLSASYLQLFLCIVISNSQDKSFAPPPNIRETLNYIENHITEELPLEQLAARAGLSCSQFKANFKREMSISPRCYINQQKIEYAKQLLREGKSITETAMILNFSTSSYFSSVFKKYTICTPSEYLQSLHSPSAELTDTKNEDTLKTNP